MKHLTTYKIFESSENAPNFCDAYYKKINDIVNKADLDKSKVINEYIDIIDEVMNDLTDDFDFKFDDSTGTFRLYYTFDFKADDYKGKWDSEKGCSLWKSTMDKFEKESENVISRLEGMNIPYKVSGSIVNGTGYSSASLGTIRNRGEIGSKITFSIGD